MEYRRMENLRTCDYIYPEEDSLFNQISKESHLNKMMGKIVALDISISALPQAQANLFRVTKKSCPKVNALFELAKARLNLSEEIPLFIRPSFDFNAHAYGGTSPFIIINSSFIKNCSDENVLFVLGHELGHLKGDHIVHQRTVGMLIDQIITRTGIGTYLTQGICLMLYNWIRTMEYSADRAGAIASGGPDNAIYGIQTLLGVHEKLKGVHVTGEDLLEQCNAYQEENESIVSKLVMLNYILKSSQPWLVDRIRVLNKWKESGEFEALVRRLGRSN